MTSPTRVVASPRAPFGYTDAALRFPSSPALLPLFVLDALTAFVALVGFKLALFSHAAFGAEGQTSAARTFAKLGLCLGWDVVGALLIGALGVGLQVALGRTRLRPRIGRARLALQAAHGLFLAVSLEVSRVVGAPLEKAALDLAFFNEEGGAQGGAPMASSIAPYLTWSLAPQLVAAVLVPVAVHGFLSVRLLPLRRWTRWTLAALGAALFIASAFVIPGLANGRAAVHTHGLERSPLPLLLGSYLRDPVRRLVLREAPPADPFCLPLGVPAAAQGGARAPGENPLRDARPRRTNVVVVLLESVGLRNLETGAMPFLDGLRTSPRSVNFARHYATWPQTMKAVFSLLCSELPYPHYTPITYVNPAIPCVSLSEALKGAGYETALFMSGDIAFDRAVRFFKHRKLDVIKDRNEVPAAKAGWNNTWGTDERTMVGALLSWLDDRKADGRTAPFFVHYNFVTGHHPYEYPGHPMGKGLSVEEEAAAQRRTLGFVDDRLRDLVDGLRARGLLEDTLIAIVSDHGPGSGRPGMGRVRDASVYEGSVHVPLVLHGPQLGAGGEIAFTTSHLDVAPTVLGLVGVPVPRTMKGRDLRVDDGPRLAIMSTRPPLSQLGVVAGRWKLVHWQETGVSELFDVHADPAESRDLSDQRRDVVNTLVTAGRGWQRHSRHLIENYAAVLKTAGRRCGAGPRRP